MKKLIFLFAFVAIFMVDANSQIATQVTTNDTLTNADSVYSQPIVMGKLYYISTQVVVDSLTGNPAGTAKLQSSVDGVNYSDVSGKTLSLNGSGTYSTVWQVSPPHEKYYKILYISTGTATLNCNGWIVVYPYK